MKLSLKRLILPLFLFVSMGSFARMCVLEMVAEINAGYAMLAASNALTDAIENNLATPIIQDLTTNLNGAQTVHENTETALNACEDENMA